MTLYRCTDNDHGQKHRLTVGKVYEGYRSGDWVYLGNPAGSYLLKRFEVVQDWEIVTRTLGEIAEALRPWVDASHVNTFPRLAFKSVAANLAPTPGSKGWWPFLEACGFERGPAPIVDPSMA